jgi:outer membrane protein assembly factor BamA
MANAAVASIGYDRRWRTSSDAAHHVEASFGVRAGTHSLESDLDYRRYLGQGSYRYDRTSPRAGDRNGWRDHGDCPLFERFTLGDSTTPGAGTAADIAPAGADRMFHTSIEYRYTGLALFLDVGSVWDAGTERQVRVSTGFWVPRGARRSWSSASC